MGKGGDALWHADRCERTYEVSRVQLMKLRQHFHSPVRLIMSEKQMACVPAATSERWRLQLPWRQRPFNEIPQQGVGCLTRAFNRLFSDSGRPCGGGVRVHALVRVCV